MGEDTSFVSQNISPFSPLDEVLTEHTAQPELTAQCVTTTMTWAKRRSKRISSPRLCGALLSWLCLAVTLCSQDSGNR